MHELFTHCLVVFSSQGVWQIHISHRAVLGVRRSLVHPLVRKIQIQVVPDLLEILVVQVDLHLRTAPDHLCRPKSSISHEKISCCAFES